MPLLLATDELPPLLPGAPGLLGLLALREGVLALDFFLPCLAPPPRPSGFLGMFTVAVWWLINGGCGEQGAWRQELNPNDDVAMMSC